MTPSDKGLEIDIEAPDFTAIDEKSGLSFTLQNALAKNKGVLVNFIRGNY